MPKRIIVIGCPGSGKSTFARALQNKTGLPLYYLDMMYWNADKTTVDRDCFDRRLDEVLKQDGWIIDGNYNRTLEVRLKRCDTVFFFDLPKEVCLEGAKSRVGTVRPDLPWVETEVDTEFEEFITNFSTTSRPKIISLLEKYGDRSIVTFRSRSEVEKYLENL